MKEILVPVFLFFILITGVYSNQKNISIDFKQSVKGADYSDKYNDIEKCLSEAMRIVLKKLDVKRDLNIKILVEISDLKKYPRIRGAGAQSEEFVLFKRTKKGNIYQQGFADYIFNENSHLLKKYHFKLIINNCYLEKQLWFDPDPISRVVIVPENKIDAVSVFIHEILHVLAFNGWLDSKTGKSRSPNNAKSVYDTHVVVYNGNLFFNGSNAVKVYGGKVPLNKRNYKHYGNNDNIGADLKGKVMYGEFYKFGYRFYLSDLDLAILKDCGLELTK